MFTGIIEHLGKITSIQTAGTNRIFDIRVPFKDSIQVDQSIAHNGVCLTVTHIHEQSVEKGTHYSVTAIDETLQKTNLGKLKVGDIVNIERCMRVGDRLDGHFVQGHVDDVGLVEKIEDEDGSWVFHFSFDKKHAMLMVDKGSICVNGVSLTVVKSEENRFSVAIIPYTFAQTNFHQLKPGDAINLEFDILGKYMLKLMSKQ